jgi:hypothetical protein
VVNDDDDDDISDTLEQKNSKKKETAKEYVWSGLVSISTALPQLTKVIPSLQRDRFGLAPHHRPNRRPHEPAQRQ